MMRSEKTPAPGLNALKRLKITNNTASSAVTCIDLEAQESQNGASLGEAPKEIERRKFLKYLLTSGIVLSSAGSLAYLFTGCKSGKGKEIEIGYDFLEHLNEAHIAPKTEKFKYVKRTFFKVAGEGKEVLFEHPNTQVIFKEVFIPKASYLTFSIGINEAVWDKEGDGVFFKINLTDERTHHHLIYSRYIDPKNNPADRKWFDGRIDLNAFAGQKVSFTFKTLCGPAGGAWDLAGWSRPQVVPLGKKRIPGKRKTNVILISIDTLRADHLGCYGYKKSTSPNLDKFALEGIQFMQAFSPSPWTLPSHMSMLTSLYPDVHKAMEKESTLDPVWTSLAQVMKMANYNTAGFVRACVWLNPEFGFDRGFDIYAVSNDNAEQVNKNVFSWLTNHKDDNFFLFLHYYDVHSDWNTLPYDSPPPYNQMFLPDYKGKFMGCGEGVCASKYLAELNKKRIVLPPGDIDYIRGMYDGGIRYTDTHVGELLKKIDRLGLRENTLVVITSDHGEEFQEHNSFLHNQVYNETMHVPLLIRFPGKIPVKKRVYQPVEIIDILPTILDLVKIKPHNHFQGRTLVPSINGKDKGKGSVVYGTGRTGQELILKDNLKFIYTLPTKKKELYNLKNDLEEKMNLADSHKGKVGIMMKGLLDWMKKNEVWRKRFKAGKTKRKGELSKEETERLKTLGYLE
jgi:arylsulfatase A-like enzyme